MNGFDDTFDRLLEDTRAQGAFTLRCVMRDPWSLRIAAEAPVTVIVAIAGAVWIVPDTGEPLHLHPGDVAVTRAPEHYTVAGKADEPPTVFIHPGQRCCDAQGRSLLEEMTHDVRTWGNDPQGDTVFLVGAYEHLSRIGDRLRGALPPLLAVRKEDCSSPLIDLLCGEVVRDEPGQAAVLDRLLDLLLTSVLKAWIAQQSVEDPIDLSAPGNPVVERALALLHQDPAFPWTLETLAARTHASRASLARRFNETIGEPPMTFLKKWRMALAADLLCRPGETVASVAAQVGYASPFAFSTAFKKVRGLSPQAHRSQGGSHGGPGVS